AAAHVDEVIEEPVLIRFAGEEAQGREHALARRLPRDIAAFDADGVGGEPEADRGNAGERGRRKAVGNEAIPGITGLPEEAERAPAEATGYGSRSTPIASGAGVAELPPGPNPAASRSSGAVG